MPFAQISLTFASIFKPYRFLSAACFAIPVMIRSSLASETVTSSQTSFAKTVHILGVVSSFALRIFSVATCVVSLAKKGITV